jgi:hypothetical protein
VRRPADPVVDPERPGPVRVGCCTRTAWPSGGGAASARRSARTATSPPWPDGATS